MKLAVVGGGVAGLAAAWAARDRGEVTVFEREHLGGKILTTEFCGHRVDCGADAFITRSPEAIELCASLGLAGDLVPPAAGRTLLWSGGRLRPLPAGLVLGVPRELGAVAISGLLSPLGVARAGLDLVLPRRTLGDDCSVFDLVAGRFGKQVAARLVDPLIGGIHAGRTEELSAAATAPAILAAARRHRSLLLGLRRDAAAPEDAGPLFLAPRGGMGALVDALVSGLREAGVTFVRSAVNAVRPTPSGGVAVDGERFDGAVLAIPADAAASVLGALSPAGLSQIRTASVVVVTLAYQGLELPAGANGILVPRGEGRLMTACSFGSSKWPHWSSPGSAVLRVSAGRSSDERALGLDDSALVSCLSDEVASALGRTVAPTAWRVSRWPDSFPQYEVGHLARVDAIETALRRDLPGVALAGASYRGAGVPACIASGRRAATPARGAT